jgi:phosphoribosyl 1,2-cyclic phosphodiesterase
MMRMTVLASGSKGNCLVVSSSRTRLLVDAGLSCRELFKRMRAAEEDPATLDAILITHEHQDHVHGLAATARKLGIPVYWTAATHRAWMRWMVPRKRTSYAEWLESRRQGLGTRDVGTRDLGTRDLGTRDLGTRDLGARDAEVDAEVEVVGDEAASEIVFDGVGLDSAGCGAAGVEDEALVAEKDPCRLPGVEYFEAGSVFSVGDISVSSFTIPHDAADPVGFVFEVEGVRVGLATDLGYVPPNVQHRLRGCDVLMIESNHDLEMLRDGPYPWSVKQRVMSRVGHLSNEAAAGFLEKNYDGRATYVVLAHLSESNNLPELARVAAEGALRERASLLDNRLVLAGQHEPMAPICL